LRKAPGLVGWLRRLILSGGFGSSGLRIGSTTNEQDDSRKQKRRTHRTAVYPGMSHAVGVIRSARHPRQLSAIEPVQLAEFTAIDDDVSRTAVWMRVHCRSAAWTVEFSIEFAPLHLRQMGKGSPALAAKSIDHVYKKRHVDEETGAGFAIAHPLSSGLRVDQANLTNRAFPARIAAEDTDSVGVRLWAISTAAIVAEQTLPLRVQKHGCAAS
jgi:hypothetical protein